MADVVKAVQAYSPRIIKGKTVKTDELVSFIAGRTSYNKSTIVATLLEFQEVIVTSLKAGRAVKLEGLGTFSPGINKEGVLRVNFRAEKKITRGINWSADYPFKGKFKNQDMIGKSKQDYIKRWNTEHPDDPVREK
jgi:nucleoid DNA-binding protein